MIKYIFALLLIIILFTNTDCKDEPIKPCTDCPTQLDTTSHEFVWTIDTLGDGSSQLNDVTIINDTCVWAVGSMYLRDSSGNFINPIYNAAYWNGKQWNLKRITTNFRGNFITPLLEGAFSFSAADIWFVGSLPIHGDGKNWNIFDLRSMPSLENISVSKAWGDNSSSMYFVGLGGSIVHYNGTSWQKIESGTSLDIQDIWGSRDYKTGEEQILAVASNKYTEGARKILRIPSSNTVDTIEWSPQRRVHSVWFPDKENIYISGGGIFKRINDTWEEVTDVPLIFTNQIRGNNKNDIVAAGDFGILAHYNGRNWRIYSELSLPSGNYESVAIRNNIIVAVGWSGDKAIVVMGKRK